jgi:signal transduction histidine kinase
MAGTRTEPRGTVRLPPRPGPDALLRPPLLPADAAAQVPIACRAAVARIPVLLAAPAPGRLRLARALHATSGHEGPLLAAVGRRPPLADVPPGAALHVDVGALAPEALLALEALLDDGTVWLLAGVEPAAALPAALAARLAAVSLVVPPLRARTAELAAIAGIVVETLAGRMNRAAPRLGAAALAHLAAHDWPGDVVELEAVLGRALLATPGDVVEAAHLALAGAPAASAPPPAVARPAAADLEFVLAELAHELRNPMVTIKTFARHLPEMLEDADLRARFAHLSDEAIARMDAVLENVLDFARFGTPAPEPIEVGPLLDRAVADVEPELTERAVRVRRTAVPSAHCAGDPAQLGYALRNLFTGIVREVPAREEVTVDASANGVVTLRFAAGGEAAERLRRLAAPPSSNGDEAAALADPTLLPLSFRLARTVLERNGGTLAVVPDGGDATTVVVRLPTAAVAG